MDQIYVDSIAAPLNLSQEGVPSEPPTPHIENSPLSGSDPFTSSHRRHVPPANLERRITELESENLRLHRLVAELLIKNQQLRRLDQSE